MQTFTFSASEEKLESKVNNSAFGWGTEWGERGSWAGTLYNKK